MEQGCTRRGFGRGVQPAAPNRSRCQASKGITIEAKLKAYAWLTRPESLFMQPRQILIGWRAGGQLPSLGLRKLHPQCGSVALEVSDENPGAGTANRPHKAIDHDAETLSGLARVK
jgi:hypothetical protein